MFLSAVVICDLLGCGLVAAFEAVYAVPLYPSSLILFVLPSVCRAPVRLREIAIIAEQEK